MSANEYTREQHKFLEFNVKVPSGSYQYEGPWVFSQEVSIHLITVTITFVNEKDLKREKKKE